MSHKSLFKTYGNYTKTNELRLFVNIILKTHLEIEDAPNDRDVDAPEDLEDLPDKGDNLYTTPQDKDKNVDLPMYQVPTFARPSMLPTSPLHLLAWENWFL